VGVDDTTTGDCDGRGAGDADFFSKVMTSPSVFLMTTPLFALSGSWKFGFDGGAGLLELAVDPCAAWLTADMPGVAGCAIAELGRSEAWDGVRDIP